MTAWVIPNTDVGISRWLEQCDDKTLDRFIRESEYVLDAGAGDGELHLAVILGAARRWRDERIPPLQTIDETATPGFFAEAA